MNDRILCQLCGDFPDAPMLKDEIWNRMGGKKLLCFECAEHLLKRELRLTDLLDCAANYATFVMVRRAMKEKSRGQS